MTYHRINYTTMRRLCGSLMRVRAEFGDVPDVLRHSDALHVVALEDGFESWPKLEFDVETRDMIRSQIHLPDALSRTKSLIAFGLPFDHADPQGLTPVQTAGWDGSPDVMAFLLSLGPDLGHINGYGGDLMSTIIHGSENTLDTKARDHLACAGLVLDAGAALRQSDIAFAGDPDMAGFLADWAEANPGKLSEVSLE